MFFNLTCERAFHPALLGADIASTLLELLCPSTRGASGESTGSRNNDPASAATPAEGRGEGEGGEGGAATDSTHGDASTAGSPKGVDNGDQAANDDQNKPGFENAQESGVVEASSRGEGGSETTPSTLVTNAGAAADGGHSAITGNSMIRDAIDSQSSSGPFNKHRTNDGTARGISDTKGGGAPGRSSDGVTGGVMAQRPSLQVRRDVLGAVMNLTTSSLEHERLDPSAVMCLLTLIIHEDPNERCVQRKTKFTKKTCIIIGKNGFTTVATTRHIVGQAWSTQRIKRFAKCGYRPLSRPNSHLMCRLIISLAFLIRLMFFIKHVHG